jgi:hypothetical protein
MSATDAEIAACCAAIAIVDVREPADAVFADADAVSGGKTLVTSATEDGEACAAPVMRMLFSKVAVAAAAA